MKTKRIGWCVVTKDKNRFKPHISSADTNREEAITNHWWGKKTYQRRRRRGETKTIPVYANEADLEA